MAPGRQIGENFFNAFLEELLLFQDRNFYAICYCKFRRNNHATSPNLEVCYSHISRSHNPPMAHIVAPL